MLRFDILLYHDVVNSYDRANFQISYSFGSAEGMELARKHYATAVKLNPCNLRALYGFYLV